MWQKRFCRSSGSGQKRGSATLFLPVHGQNLTILCGVHADTSEMTRFCRGMGVYSLSECVEDLPVETDCLFECLSCFGSAVLIDFRCTRGLVKPSGTADDGSPARRSLWCPPVWLSVSHRQGWGGWGPVQASRALLATRR